jgi:hypothetical protein
MDQSLKGGQVAMGMDRHRVQAETPRSDSPEPSAEIAIPSTASWSEGLSNSKEDSWVGY